ncbi:MAG: hypothetical protein ABSD63_11920 [Candidatus Korobacteraceae bacterium]|jgi:hypothetical protein
MGDPSEERILFQSKPTGSASVPRQIVRFVLHLAAVYVTAKFSTQFLAEWIQDTLLPALQSPRSSSRFEFLLSHLFAFSFGPAVVVGLCNARFRHKVAEFVWLVPAVILAYKFFTYSTGTSVLQAESWRALSAFHQYFGGGFVVPDYRNWKQFWAMVASNPDMTRALDQLTFTGPFYAGVGYSVGAWIGRRTELDRKIVEKVRRWEKWKFGRQP